MTPREDEGMQPRPSLRDRKQARARQDLQRAAIRLVEQRGYQPVSVEDICQAAEVSRSTFFRYFGTKAAVFEADLVADRAMAQLGAETEFSLQRLRTLIGQGYRDMDDAEYDRERRRVYLLQTVPELRAGFAQEVVRPLSFTMEYCSRLLHADRDDAGVRRLAGVIFGVLATMQLPNSSGQIELPATKHEAATKVEAALDGLAEILRPDAFKSQ